MGCFPGFHQVKKFLWVLAGKVDRTCVCITYIHMMDTVLLLILSSKLMFLDNAIHIVINRAAADQTGLRFTLAGQLIDVITRCSVLNQNSILLHIDEVFTCTVIDFLIVKIRICRKVHLCTVHMQERIRILISDLLCLLPRHYIIWKCRYCLCLVRNRSEGTECLKNSHFYISFVLSFFLCKMYFYFITSPSTLQ